MCLFKKVPLKTKNPKFKLSKDEKGYYGWKIYNWINLNHMLATPEYCGKEQKIQKWIDSKSHSLKRHLVDTFNNYYPCGFHVYVCKPKANGGFRRKVYVKGIIAKGFQSVRSKKPAIVCRKIFIDTKRGS
jgi:hypothetical protein